MLFIVNFIFSDKAVSPTTPEIDPRAVREALKFLQGTTDIDDDVVRKALMTIKVGIF